MSYFGPVWDVPSWASSPVVGFGLRGLGIGGLGYGLGSRWGLGSGLGSGAVAPTLTLGLLAGVQPSPVNQIPPSEAVIEPPPFVVTLPGAILSATCEPLAVGGYTPCAPSGSGYAGLSGGYLGSLGRRRIIF